MATWWFYPWGQGSLTITLVLLTPHHLWQPAPEALRRALLGPLHTHLDSKGHGCPAGPCLGRPAGYIPRRADYCRRQWDICPTRLGGCTYLLGGPLQALYLATCYQPGSLQHGLQGGHILTLPGLPRPPLPFGASRLAPHHQLWRLALPGW